jgi:hypothetical protein
MYNLNQPQLNSSAFEFTSAFKVKKLTTAQKQAGLYYA